MQVLNQQQIYYRNDLRPEIIKMQTPARRLFALALRRMPKEYDNETGLSKIVFHENYEVIINASEYQNICGVDSSTAYQQMHEGISALMNVKFKSTTSNPLEIDQDLLLNPITYEGEVFPVTQVKIIHAVHEAIYLKGVGAVKIVLHRNLAPFISNLVNGFTSVMFKSVAKLKDNNAAKLYFVLNEFVSQGATQYKIISVKALKEMMGLEDKYHSWGDFNVYLNKAKATLIRDTDFDDIKVTVIEKFNRKAYKLKIEYKINQDCVDQSQTN